MFKINKITSNPTVDYAAEELKKYLRMMMPDAGEIVISFNPDAIDGFRLGLMQDFSLDVSEAEDTSIDDILHIDTDCEGGIIAGSNVRSVLLAVYKYLTLNGCRWLFPGIDGEFIPVRDVAPTAFHKMADNRYRGWPYIKHLHRNYTHQGVQLTTLIPLRPIAFTTAIARPCLLSCCQSRHMRSKRS